MAWLLTGLDSRRPRSRASSRCKIPDRALRLALARVLMLSGVKLIDFAGADWAIAGGAIAAGLGFAAWALVARPGVALAPRRPTSYD